MFVCLSRTPNDAVTSHRPIILILTTEQSSEFITITPLHCLTSFRRHKSQCYETKAHYCCRPRDMGRECKNQSHAIYIPWIPWKLSFRYILFHEKRLLTMLWHRHARVNSHQRWKQTRFRVCFHLWCELTSTINVTEWQISWNLWFTEQNTYQANSRRERERCVSLCFTLREYSEGTQGCSPLVQLITVRKMQANTSTGVKKTNC